MMQLLALQVGLNFWHCSWGPWRNPVEPGLLCAANVVVVIVFHSFLALL